MTFVFLFENLILFIAFLSRNSLLIKTPISLISSIKTLLTVSFLLPKVVIEVLDSLRSMYIQTSLSNVLSVDGGPKAFKISFLFVEFRTSFSCFLSKKCTPWCVTTLFVLQFEININKIVKKKTLFMNNKYINIYNNLINLTRNKDLYKTFIKQDTFSDRLLFFLIHFAFLLKAFKKNDPKVLQDIYDCTFRHLELNIREIGYGDASINKKMKDYINLFHSIIEKIDDWDLLNQATKKKRLKSLIYVKDNDDLIAYFDNFSVELENNTLNFYIKSVIKIKN